MGGENRTLMFGQKKTGGLNPTLSENQPQPLLLPLLIQTVGQKLNEKANRGIVSANGFSLCMKG